MFDKNMLEELMKKNTEQQSQMEEMQKQMQEAQAMIAGQIQQAMAQY